MILLEGVSYTYPNGNKPIFNNVNLSFKNRGFYFVKGYIGCGKTTLLKLLSGTIAPQKGTITYNNNSLDELFSSEAYITQMPILFEDLSALDNLLMFSNDRQKIENILKKLNLTSLKNVKVRKISNGEKQRLTIARALIMNKTILLCDEITSMLDKENRDIVLQILKELSQDILIIAVSHQEKYYSSLADVVIEIKDESVNVIEVNDCERKDEILKHEKTNINEGKLIVPFWWSIVKKSIITSLMFLFVYGLFFYVISSINNHDYTIKFDNYYLEHQIVKDSSFDGSSYSGNYIYEDNLYYFKPLSIVENKDSFQSAKAVIDFLKLKKCLINPIVNEGIIYGKNRLLDNEITIGISNDYDINILKRIINAEIKIYDKTLYIRGFYLIENKEIIELNINPNNDYQVLLSTYDNQDFFNQFNQNVEIEIGNIDCDMIISSDIERLFFISQESNDIDYLSTDYYVDPNLTNKIVFSKDIYKLLIHNHYFKYTAFYDDKDKMKKDMYFFDGCVYPFGFNLHSHQEVLVGSRTNTLFLGILFFDTFLLLFELLGRYKKRSLINTIKDLEKMFHVDFKKALLKRELVFLGLLLAFDILLTILIQFVLPLAIIPIILCKSITYFNYMIIKIIRFKICSRGNYDRR